MNKREVVISGRRNVIAMSNETFKAEQLRGRDVVLHYGAMAIPCQVKIDGHVPPGTIIVPQQLSELIHMPVLPYDYYFQQQQLYIGPVIGIHVSSVHDRNPAIQLSRFAQYERIRGLVFLFKERKVNKETASIRGYYYDAASEPHFVRHTLPLPAVIFNRAPLGEATYRYLMQHGCDTIFNYPYGISNKWALWETMSQVKGVKNHLPYTVKYSAANLKMMLNAYSELYIKPASLAQGKGVMRIRSDGMRAYVTTVRGRQYEVVGYERLHGIVQSKMVANSRYIIQQAIPFYHRGHKLDFRLYFQKELTEQWHMSAMEAKIAHRGSIITNARNRLYVRPGRMILKEAFGWNEGQVEHKLQEMTHVCTTVFSEMTRQGYRLGDVAVDAIIDERAHFWILEVQLNYTAETKTLRSPDEKAVLPHIMPTPLVYARTRAGFARKE